jgi:hypothetical protein
MATPEPAADQKRSALPWVGWIPIILVALYLLSPAPVIKAVVGMPRRVP